MSHEEEPKICILKTLLSKAQLLMCDIEELLQLCASTWPPNQRQSRTIQQECEASIEEDGDALIVEGFRFESAVSGEELAGLRSQPAAGRHGGT